MSLTLLPNDHHDSWSYRLEHWCCCHWRVPFSRCLDTFFVAKSSAETDFASTETIMSLNDTSVSTCLNIWYIHHCVSSSIGWFPFSLWVFMALVSFKSRDMLIYLSVSWQDDRMSYAQQCTLQYDCLFLCTVLTLHLKLQHNCQQTAETRCGQQSNMVICFDERGLFRIWGSPQSTDLLQFSFTFPVIWSPFIVASECSPDTPKILTSHPDAPCMVFLPTLGWFIG